MNIKLIKERDPALSFAEQVLSNRGITDFEHFWNLDESCLCSPYDLDFMKEGIELFDRHVRADSKIAILIDVDVDGFTSSAVLYNYFTAQKNFGDEWKDSKAEWFFLFHEAKTHGLADTEIMRRLRDEIRPNLLVIPDASGTQAQYDALTSLGIDILVLDHHDTDVRGDGENVIVINNQQSERYKNKDFSGVGVVWQFCRALDDKLTLACADKWRDLVAVGNCADVMDLRSPETRYLITQGLKDENINSYFLQFCQFSMYTMQDKHYNPHTISFNIAPLFNSVCRLGDMQTKEMLFKSLLDDMCQQEVPNGTRGHDGEMVPMIQEAIRLASNTKGRQDRRKDKLVEQIEEVICEENLLAHKVLVLAFDDFKEEYRALSGLVAGKIAEIYQRPTIITFRKEDGSYSGSLRVNDSNNPAYQNFKDQCQESGCCTFVAGHQAAAGIGIKGDCVKDLIAFFDNRYENISNEMFHNVDFIIDANDPELPDLIHELADMSEIWGKGIEEPTVAVKNVPLGPGTLALMGKRQNTLAFNLPSMKFINFRSSKEEFDSLMPPNDGEVLQYYNATVIGIQPEMNVFGNRSTPQMQIADYHIDNISYDF